MRRLSILALLALAGCQTSGGPLGYGRPSRPGGLSIEEQKSIARERYSIVEDDKLSVKCYVDRPSFVGR